MRVTQSFQRRRGFGVAGASFITPFCRVAADGNSIDYDPLVSREQNRERLSNKGRLILSGIQLALFTFALAAFAWLRMPPMLLWGFGIVWAFGIAANIVNYRRWKRDPNG